MRKYLTMAVPLVAGVACAVVLASCGGGGTLSGATAQQLLDALDKMQTEASQGSCSTVASDASNVASQVEARTDIDAKLRVALVSGFQNLAQLAEQPGGCKSTTTTQTTTTETATTESTPTHPDTTPDTVTTPTQTTPTQTTPTQTTTTGTGGTGGGGSGGVGL